MIVVIVGMRVIVPVRERERKLEREEEENNPLEVRRAG